MPVLEMAFIVRLDHHYPPGTIVAWHRARRTRDFAGWAEAEASGDPQFSARVKANRTPEELARNELNGISDGWGDGERRHLGIATVDVPSAWVRPGGRLARGNWEPFQRRFMDLAAIFPAPWLVIWRDPTQILREDRRTRDPVPLSGSDIGTNHVWAGEQ